MNFVNRIEYQPYVAASSKTDGDLTPTKDETIFAGIEARASHLAALGFFLNHFNPQDMKIDVDESLAIQNYGSLIRSISDGLFSAVAELEELFESATTFTDTIDEVQ